MGGGAIGTKSVVGAGREAGKGSALGEACRGEACRGEACGVGAAADAVCTGGHTVLASGLCSSAPALALGGSALAFGLTGACSDAGAVSKGVADGLVLPLLDRFLAAATPLALGTAADALAADGSFAGGMTLGQSVSLRVTSLRDVTDV